MKVSRETLFLYGFKGLQWAAWGTCASALAAAGMLLLTPCLLPFITLGGCLIQGRHEYMEYAITSWHMAFFPLCVAAITALVGFGLRMIMKRFHEKAKRAEAEQLDLMRLKNLKQNPQRLPTRS